MVKARDRLTFGGRPLDSAANTQYW